MMMNGMRSKAGLVKEMEIRTITMIRISLEARTEGGKRIEWGKANIIAYI
jgi:hypothetical protein